MQKHSHKYFIVFVTAVVMMFGFAQRSQAQQLGLKLNALMWAAGTPSVGMEVVLGQRSSLDLSAFGHYKPYTFDSKLIAFQPEYRYWFNGRPFTREFIGATIMVADYDITTRSYVYDGNAVSAGITGGYSFLLNKRWRLELCGGFSFLYFRQKKYYVHDNYDDYFVGTPVKANSWGYKLFPAKLGVTFTYIIK